MNCPQCKEDIGRDQQGQGPYTRRYDKQGLPTSVTQILVIRCDCCGLFEIETTCDNPVTKIKGPITDPAAVKRLSRFIQADRLDRYTQGTRA